MRKIIVTVFFMLAAQAQAAIITATANLDYAQEVGPSNPVPSLATGTAQLAFDTIENMVQISAQITGISLSDITFPAGGLAFGAAGPLHIHNGAFGVNGGIVVPFGDASFFSESSDGFSVMGSASFDPAILTALNTGELYLNLHSLDYASGEIRGQIPEPSALALLLLGVIGLGITRARRRT